MCGVADGGKGVTDDSKGLERKASRQRRLHQNDALKQLATLRSRRGNSGFSAICSGGETRLEECFAVYVFLGERGK